MITKFAGHTPGPWRVEGRHKNIREIRQPLAGYPHLEGTGRLLATIVFASLEDAELIAAAPDLLALLVKWYEKAIQIKVCGIDISPELRLTEQVLGINQTEVKP